MRIECVVPCIGYGDYLALTLPRNTSHCDRIIVVTSLADAETRDVCARAGVECVFIERDRWDRQREGEAMNAGFAACAHADWVLRLDADVALAPDFRARVEARKPPLDVNRFYGAHRFRCASYDAWTAYAASGSHEFPIYKTCGELGIGYFQLFNVRARALAGAPPVYPDATCAVPDKGFLLRWGWGYLDDVGPYVVHLEHGECGANWRGRTTPRFGPKK